MEVDYSPIVSEYHLVKASQGLNKSLGKIICNFKFQNYKNVEYKYRYYRIYKYPGEFKYFIDLDEPMGIEIKEWANCVQSKKVCYKNKEHAEVAGVAYRQKAYPCKHCGYWHLASKK